MAKENDSVYDDILEIPEIEVDPDRVEGLFSPDVPSGESASLQRVNPFVGLELTVNQFRNWFGNQGLGSRPFNAIGFHHTYRPDESTWNGLVTLRGMFNYYAGLGWPPGVGPHLYLYDGTGRYKHGQPLVYVGTHPAANGIAISYRNDRWFHVEHVGYYDNRRMSDEMQNLSGEVLDILANRRGISYERVGPGINSPSRPGGILFHRDAPNAGKTCPGNKVRSLPPRGGRGPKAPSPDPKPGTLKRMTRYRWLQDNSAPAPVMLTYEGKDEWRVTRAYSNPRSLPEMSRWQWSQDNSAPAPVMLTYRGKPAWKVEREKQDSKPVSPGGPDTNKSAPRVRHTNRIAYSSWTANAEEAAREIYGKFRPHALHSYDAHGASGYKGDLAKGDSASIDFYVTGYNQQPTKEELALGWEIANYATKNWRRLGVQCVIFNGKINTFDNRGWRDYDPSVYPDWKWGDANWPTKIHDNHPHVRIKR